MNKIPVILIATALICLSLTGCLSDEDKLIGTWQFSEGGTITFYTNNTVSIQNIRPLVAIQLNGIFTYSLADHNITFTSHSAPVGITLTFTYTFTNDTTLVLKNSVTITLTKVK
jgi:hypothetical protein